MPRLRVDKQGFPIRWKKILVLVEQGYKPQEIASKLSMDSDWVYKVLKTPTFIAATVKLHEKAIDAARAIFEKNAVVAANKIAKIANRGKPEDRVQLDAAKEILYQIGLKPVEVIETRQREYTPQEIESAAKVTGEVESILDRLESKQSSFVLDGYKEADEAPHPAPVLTANEVEVEKSAIESGIHETSAAGQETLPA
jgi:hypothetical protein